jgi:DNA-binding MarR family transcriptional regulator
MHFIEIVMINSQHLVDNCACTRLRTVARLMTRAYDEALQPAGLNASQLAILAAIDVDDATSIAALSKRLAMDRTTLSRNLKPLERAKWIRLGAEGWKRSKTVHVTSEGRQRLTRAASLWDTAQSGFLKRFGKAEWKRVDADLKAVAALF